MCRALTRQCSGGCRRAAAGLIKLVDVAPEEPGNLAFIRECGGEVRVSIAHTCTDYDTAKAAFAAGARHMTHLYNAMPGITHRAPGPIIAALEDGATVELITDGVHIHPAMGGSPSASLGMTMSC